MAKILGGVKFQQFVPPLRKWPVVFCCVLLCSVVCCCVLLVLDPPVPPLRWTTLHTTAREPKRACLRAPAFKNTTKIQREDSQRQTKRTKWQWERGKKRAKFRDPHPSGPPPFGAPTLRGPTMTHTRSRNELSKNGLAKNGLAQVGQIRMAKTGLAKVGPFPPLRPKKIFS